MIFRGFEGTNSPSHSGIQWEPQQWENSQFYHPTEATPQSHNSKFNANMVQDRDTPLGKEEKVPSLCMLESLET